MKHILVAAILLATPAAAHDHYTGMTNRNGVVCCGDKDCAVYTGPARQVRGGWIVGEEFVSDDKVQASFDSNYHKCFWGGETKCFLVPINM